MDGQAKAPMMWVQSWPHFSNTACYELMMDILHRETLPQDGLQGST
jgi:hypothetical protein